MTPSSYLKILLTLLVVWSCDKSDEVGPSPKMGFVKFDIEAQESPQDRILQNTIISGIRLSVKDENDEFVFNNDLLDLVLVGDDYITDNVELQYGTFEITDFIVVNSEDSALYIAPKESSALEEYVQDPLPIQFTISAEETAVTVEVLKVDTIPVTEFGYNSFGIKALSVLEIQPGPSAGKDALIALHDPDKNHGSYTSAHLYSWTHSGQPAGLRNLLEFDLTGISPETNIDSAFLNLYFDFESQYIDVLSLDGHSGNNAFSIQRITESWVESVVTWNTQPAVTEDGQALVPDTDIPDFDFTFIDITEIIQYQFENPSENHGMMIKHQDESPYSVTFHASSDHSVISIRPKLTIYYH